MLMAPDSWKELYQNTLKEARSGEIPQARIDDAVRRILRVKAAAGLFGRAGTNAPSEAQLGAPAGKPRASRNCSRSGAQITGPAEERACASCRSIRTPTCSLPAMRPTTSACRAVAGPSTGRAITTITRIFPARPRSTPASSAAVRAAGGTADLEPRRQLHQQARRRDRGVRREPLCGVRGGPRDARVLARRRPRAAIAEAAEERGHSRPFRVFLSGRPLWVNPELNASDAFVAAWLPGSEGEGVADVLFRAADGTVPSISPAG